MTTSTGLVMAMLGFCLFAANWSFYWGTIQAVAVPLRPRAFQLANVVAVVLASLALTNEPGALGAILAAIVIPGGAMTLYLTMASAMPERVAAVDVGQRILDFEAVDADGNKFSSASLAGRPYLLKFFRGHW